VLKFAVEYLNRWKFSVIPLLPNKKPLIKWEEYQRRKPTEKEIRGWWTKYPEAMVGIITGKISNLAVIDIDTKDIPDELLGWWQYDIVLPPVVETPRGSHYYFAYEEGVTNTVNLSGKKIDIRGEGGYVVAPPSVNEEGKRYKWVVSLKDGLPKFPMKFLANREPVSPYGKNEENSENGETFIEGRRDNDLFHAAHHLIKGGMSPKDATTIVTRLASTCDPPFPINEAKTKVDSAVNRAVRKERPLANEVEEWVMSTTGVFLSTELYNCLQVSTRDERKNVSVILRRLAGKGIIEKAGRRNACWRKIELECEPIDWQNAPTDDIPLKFPLDIHELVRIYPSNIIIVAGESNAGKTAFLLNFIRLNMADHNIHYFNSEMGASELKIRLRLFEGIKDWRFTAWERSDNFIDVIRPNDFNVIDFLDVTDEFWKVGGVIKGIHEKLKKGIAVIALQKNFGRDLGRGGALSTEKPRLYLSMGSGKLKIVKAKNWRGTDNPNGMVREFKLYSGWDFSAVGYWEKPYKEEK